ncbi:MAG: elongation factor P 5-aminopentanone reductase [Lachnospiraceae bacterium]
MEENNVIITGASRGIGRAIAVTLAKNGYNLMLNCKSSQNEILSLKEELSDYSVKCEYLIGDVGSHSFAEELMEYTHKTLGRVNFLINNAGIAHIGLLQDMTYDEWDNIIRTNLTSVFNMSKLVIPDMLYNKSGRIINISSVWGICGASCEAAYSASKGAVNSFTKALGKELAPSNIQVNAIACGAVDTSMNHCFSKEELDSLCDEIPAGRMAAPDEVADMVLKLLTAPSYLTGEVIKMDGGWI